MAKRKEIGEFSKDKLETRFHSMMKEIDLLSSIVDENGINSILELEGKQLETVLKAINRIMQDSTSVSIITLDNFNYFKRKMKV